MVGEINWGILDPNAAAKAAGSFQQGQANRLALEQEGQKQAANALALQQSQKSIADENAMRQAYAQSGGDANKLVESLRGVGLHQKAMEVQGQIASQQAAAKKAQIQDALDHYKVVDQTISGAKDQTGWTNARQKLANIYGADSVANIPEQYDPAYVESAKQQGLTIKDRLDQEWKAADMQQKQFQFGQTQALERAKMGQAERHFQATQGLEREKLGTKQTAPQQIIADAKESNALLDQVEQVGSKATGSLAGSARDIAAGAVGISTEGAKNAAKMKVLGASLTAKVPKMSGPQSDKDVAMYKEAAGNVADPNVPWEVKKAAIETIREINNRQLGYQKQGAATDGSALPSGWSVQEH